MARAEKTTVDYFPYICKEGKAMFTIERKFGNDGYATWFKILRQLAVTSNHYLNLQDEDQMMFLASKCNVSEEKLQSIISVLCTLGEFDKELWEDKIVWSDKFIDNIQDAYKKRNNKCITKVELISFIHPSSSQKLYLSIPKVSEKPHTIEKNTIEEKRIEEEVSAPAIVEEKKIKQSHAEWLKELKQEGWKLKYKNHGLPLENMEVELKNFSDHHVDKIFADIDHCFNAWGIWCKNIRSHDVKAQEEAKEQYQNGKQKTSVVPPGYSRSKINDTN